jgi:hypothetical protein
MVRRQSFIRTTSAGRVTEILVGGRVVPVIEGRRRVPGNMYARASALAMHVAQALRRPRPKWP